MPPDPSTTDNLRLLRRVADSGAEFVVVGGVAAVLHGSSMLTVDLDLCIPFTVDNLSRLLPALVAADARLRAHPGRPRLAADPERFSTFRHLLLSTADGPLDLLRSIDGVGEFPAVRAASFELDLGSFRCPVLSLEAIIASKRATGRDKDLRALPELEATLRLSRQTRD